MLILKIALVLAGFVLPFSFLHRLLGAKVSQGHFPDAVDFGSAGGGLIALGFLFAGPWLWSGGIAIAISLAFLLYELWGPFKGPAREIALRPSKATANAGVSLV